MSDTIANIEIPIGWRLQNMHQKYGVFFCTLEPLTCTACQVSVSSFGKTIAAALAATIEKIRTSEQSFADIKEALDKLVISDPNFLNQGDKPCQN